jgi:AraC-like DNA-binding protein
MKPISLIRASVGLAAADLLREIGAPADRIWERSRLPAIPHLGPERLVPFHLIVGFVEDAAAVQGMNDLGLRLAQRFGLGCVGAFGAAIRHAPTLHAALEAARHGVQGHNSAAQYWTVLDGDSVRLCRRIRSAERRFRQSDLLTVALMADVVRAVAGPQWRPPRIELQSCGAAPNDRIELFSEAVVEVSRPVTSITFPRAYLSRSMTGASARAPATSWSDEWRSTSPPADFLASLEIVIGALLETRHLDIGAAAVAAATSVRSLQRRLTELGVSFSEVVDRVRFRVASELLRDESVKIIEVAYAAGYSDPAHFTRAFRRWTSLSPIEYRRLHLFGETARRSA